MANAKQLKIFIFKHAAYSAALLLGLGYSTTAFSYLDPGTGSILLQSLIAGIMVVFAAWGVFWQRIKSFFLSIFSSTKSISNDTDSGPD